MSQKIADIATGLLGWLDKQSGIKWKPKERDALDWYRDKLDAAIEEDRAAEERRSDPKADEPTSEPPKLSSWIVERPKPSLVFRQATVWDGFESPIKNYCDNQARVKL